MYFENLGKILVKSTYLNIVLTQSETHISSRSSLLETKSCLGIFFETLKVFLFQTLISHAKAGRNIKFKIKRKSSLSQFDLFSTLKKPRILSCLLNYFERI